MFHIPGNIIIVQIQINGWTDEQNMIIALFAWI
jgi:hypothetical protein